MPRDRSRPKAIQLMKARAITRTSNPTMLVAWQRGLVMNAPTAVGGGGARLVPAFCA
jgi:hypothetical protein